MARPKKEQPNRSDGLYEVKITIGKTMNGNPIRKSFYSSVSKEDAREKANQYKTEMAVANATNTAFVVKDVTFGQWAEKWLEVYKKPHVKDHTFNFTYKSNLEKYIIPYFGNADIKSISQVDVQNYINSVRNADDGSLLAKSTLEKHKMILHDIFDKAIDNDLCYKNPVKSIVIPNNVTTEAKRVYNLSEYNIAKKYAKDHEGGLGILIILETGIRRSELLGLKWSDIDFKNRQIHIQRSVVQTTGKIVEGSTKTETSNRIIPISTQFCNYLKSLTQSGEYVICGSDPHSFRSPATYAKQFKNFMQKMSKDKGLEALEPHELRHTFGTVQREKDVDIYTIQKVMGHADISITSKIYVHNDLVVLRKNMKI